MSRGSRDDPQRAPDKHSEAERARARRIVRDAPPPVDHNPPFPIAPPLAVGLADLSHLWLLIRCGCGRGAAIPLRFLAAECGWKTPLGDVVTKLRCGHCGLAPASIDLSDDPAIDATGSAKSVIGNRLRLS